MVIDKKYKLVIESFHRKFFNKVVGIFDGLFAINLKFTTPPLGLVTRVFWSVPLKGFD